ncbi:MAG: HAD hydrolase-like protein, partial [Pseudomonadota bacterium]|nr:HAD hydrolase-like protein [Pseudomonadota bacterium]
PAPGLLEQISAELQIPVRGAWYVGDTVKDMELALTSGCKPLLVRTGKGAQTEAKLDAAMRANVTIVDDLVAAAAHILKHDSLEA